MLVAADIYRPAAIDQLKTLGASLDIPVFSAPDGTRVVEIAAGAVAQARQTGRDVVILDTAGRLQIDDDLMAEIRDVHAAVEPRETLLVVDAMVGQEAVAVAEAFHENTPVSGLVLTKIDGDARGGAALSIAAVSGLAVKFMGTGERPDEFEVFHPDRLAGRILGMGDVVSLVERAQEAYDEKEAEKLAQKLQKDAFTLEDFLEQMQQVKKMGPLGNVMSMIPGLGGAAKQAQDAIDRGELARVEAIIRSMTPSERADPGILNASRRRRIAKGSGTSLPEVNRLVKQFGEMQKVMKMMRGRGGRMPGLPMGPLG
jgi:signal recognition particle subunit SRP54